MSKTSVMDKFFRDAATFLEATGLQNSPERIFNIDGTWDGDHKGGKKKKVVVPTEMKTAYSTTHSNIEHITYTMCANAAGEFMPPMITFKQSLPTEDGFEKNGPRNALYSCSESGHIDADLYFLYIKHLDKFLGNDRPVAIFQDNLGAHESLPLIEFCYAKQIHLFNFPSHVSHLLQPLDKVFGEFKEKLEKKAGEAYMLSHSMNKNKVSIIAKFAMQAIKKSTLQEAFKITGVYPLDRVKIPDEKLVGNELGGEVPTAQAPKTCQYANV
jgi:hypothetical protein